MNILVAHGGGPTPVMNSSLQGVIEGVRAAASGSKLLAGRFGADGILQNDLIDLTNLSEHTISRLAHTPATAIGSCRTKITEADYPRVLETLRKNNIHGLLYNGGNDSMDTCHKLSKMAEKSGYGLSVMGIPKTVDNDLAGTDHSPGYGSAARFSAIAAAEVGADASALPIHVVVMEFMGRNAGWITAAASLGEQISRCPMITLLPETPLDITALLAAVERKFSQGNGLLIAVSEGVRTPEGKLFAESGIVDGFGHTILGGAAQRLSDLIIEELGIRSRSEKPGLLGRASMPYVSTVDREEAYAVGREAAEAILRNESGSMVALEAHRNEGYAYSLTMAPLELVANEEKKFPVEWIEDWGIAEEFSAYCLPLLGPDLPEFAHLR